MTLLIGNNWRGGKQLQLVKGIYCTTAAQSPIGTLRAVSSPPRDLGVYLIATHDTMVLRRVRWAELKPPSAVASLVGSGALCDNKSVEIPKCRLTLEVKSTTSTEEIRCYLTIENKQIRLLTIFHIYIYLTCFYMRMIARRTVTNDRRKTTRTA